MIHTAGACSCMKSKCSFNAQCCCYLCLHMNTYHPSIHGPLPVHSTIVLPRTLLYGGGTGCIYQGIVIVICKSGGSVLGTHMTMFDPV